MMADPVTPVRRSARISSAAASSPPIAQGNDCDTFERCTPPAISKVNKSNPLAKIQTSSGHQNATAFSHGSRPSVSSVDSASTTGSSRQIDKVFDTRASTPSTDSNPTSPEQDASPSEDYMAKLSSPGIDDDCEKLTGDESPLVEREMRKKTSTKLRPGLTPSKLASQPLVSFEPALPGTESTIPPLDNASSTEPDSPSVRLCHSLQRLSLNERGDTAILPRARRTSLRPPESLSADKRARGASASGRLEENVKTGVDLSSTNKGRDEPSEAYTNPDSAKSNSGSEMRGKSTTRGRSLKTKDHAITNAETFAKNTGTSKDSPAPSNSSSSGTPMNSTSDETTSQLPFERYHNNCLTDEYIQQELIKVMKRTTTKGELQPVAEDKRGEGYIYYFTLPSCIKESGMESMTTVRCFKVGVTNANTAPGRVKEQQPCHHEKIILGKDPKPLKFAYARHVEKLILTELREFRYQLPCSGSHKKTDGSPAPHIEWIKIDEQRLLDVIEKWRRWIIRNRPYDSKGHLRPRWVWKLDTLKSEGNNMTLDDVLQPFTAQDELNCRVAWLFKQSDVLREEALELYKLLSKSPRILISGFCLYIYSGLNSIIECVGFLVAIAMISYIVSGR